MKNYTFKLKINTADGNKTIIACHMPLEAVYESIKITSELEGLHDKAHVYLYQEEECNQPDHNLWLDVLVGDLAALFASKDLKEFLVNPLTNEYEEVKDDE